MNRVALIGENSIEYIEKLIDIWNSGSCAVLIDWCIPIQIAIKMMQEADVHICYIENRFFDKVPVELPPSIIFIPFEKIDNFAKYLPESVYIKFKPNYGESEAVVLYSSGTTGKSKGIILSHFAINTNADAIIDYMKLNDRDCFYIAKPLSHSSTLTGELLVALKTFTTLIIAPTIVPPRFILQNIEKFDVSIICLSPNLLQMFVKEYSAEKYEFRKLRTIYVSGSILNDKIYREVHSALENIEIYNVYGLSECGPRVTAQRFDCCKSNSVGKPIKDVEVIIVDSDGNPVKQSEKGIIHVKTQGLFNGYLSGGYKLKSLFFNWLNTGDIGYFDKNGELNIVDRIDDVIIINSHKIYPSNVENAILANSKIECCVVSKIELSNREYLSCIYSGKKENITALRHKLFQCLISYEIPRYWMNCENIPSTTNGKYIKSEIKKLFEKMNSSEENIV